MINNIIKMPLDAEKELRLLDIAIKEGEAEIASLKKKLVTVNIREVREFANGNRTEAYELRKIQKSKTAKIASMVVFTSIAVACTVLYNKLKED